MKKATIKKVLALVVGVLIIAASLTAGIGVFAEETTANAGPVNLDFSDGFNNWTGETSLYVVNDGVLKINEETYTSGSWKYLKTEPFTIPNAVAGTVIEMSFDVEFEDGLPSMNGNENQAGTLESNPANKILDVYLADPTISTSNRLTACSESNGQRNQVFYNEEGTVVVGPQTIEDPAQVFDFWIGCGNSAKKTWQISNISLKVTHPNGKVETYPYVPKYPAYFGTAADGLDSNLTHYPCLLTPADGIYNLDFSDGFIFWGGMAKASSGALASTAFDLVTEDNGNIYAQVKADGYVSNISTVLFKAENVQAGDSLVVIYDAKGEGVANLRVKLVQEYLKEKAVYDKTTGLNTALKADGVNLLNPSPGAPSTKVGTSVENGEFALQTAADGWTTYIAESNTVVDDPASSFAQTQTGDTLRSDIYLQIVVACPSDYTEVAVGDKVDAAIDNIRIAKVVDGVYYDIADNSVIYDPNAGGNDGTGGDDNQGDNGTGNGNGGSVATGDSVLALAALFFISGAAVFGTAKAMKSR